jgi:hypothetical protein
MVIEYPTSGLLLEKETKDHKNGEEREERDDIGKGSEV